MRLISIACVLAASDAFAPSFVNVQWWSQFIILCGTVEAYKYKKAEEGKSYTGNGEPVFDYLKGYPDDEAGRRDIELKELKNGRLAMIGFASFVSAHFIPGSVPLLPSDF